MHVIHEVQGAPEHTGCEAFEAQDHAIHEAQETMLGIRHEGHENM